MEKESNEYYKQYWKKKEDEIGENIRGKILAELESGHESIYIPILGLLFYTGNAFYFQTFPKKNWLFSFLRQEESKEPKKLINIGISWKDVDKIDFIKEKKSFFGLFLPNNFRISIDYKSNRDRKKLTFKLHCKEDGDKIIEFYNKIKNSDS